MDVSPHADECPGLSLLLVLKDPPDAGTPERLAALARVLPGAEVLVHGHGDPDRIAQSLRELAAQAPSVWVELATRRQPADVALVEAVRACATPWILWLPERPHPEEPGIAQRLWREHRAEGFAGDPSCGPCLFERETLLALPRIPGMPFLLPELFSRCAGGTPAPAPGLAGMFRRGYVALACTIGQRRSPR